MPILLIAVAVVAGAGAGHGGLPYFDIPNIHIYGRFDIQPFGMLVATGVLVGAELCRRYSLKFAIEDDDLRGLMGWVVVCGFLGAHLFDVVMYNQEELDRDPLILVKVWEGISSYGGFIGGTLGFAYFVWRKRMRTALMADVIMVGLLPGFTIGRIGCSIVHDHIGRATDFALGFDYPWSAIVARHLDGEFPHAAVIHAHNLGFYELMYLIPVNAIVLGLAFGKKRRPAGMLAITAGALYAPVRFFFEFLRLNTSDPRYLGLTFAQWASILAFGTALYLLVNLIKHGKPAPLDAELGDRVGGYRDGVMAPKRTVASAASDDGDDADGDGAKKPASAKKPGAAKKSAGARKRR